MNAALQLGIAIAALFPGICLAVEQTNKPEAAITKFIQHYELVPPTLQKGEKWICLVLVPSFDGEKAIAATVRNESVDFEVREFVGPYSHDLGKYPELLKWGQRYEHGSDKELDAALEIAFKPIRHDYTSPLLDGIAYYLMRMEDTGKMEEFSAHNPQVEIPASWTDSDLRQNYFEIDGKAPSKHIEAEVRHQYQQILSSWKKIYFQLRRKTSRDSSPDPSKWDQYSKMYRMRESNDNSQTAPTIR